MNLETHPNKSLKEFIKTVVEIKSKQEEDKLVVENLIVVEDFRFRFDTKQTNKMKTFKNLLNNFEKNLFDLLFVRIQF